MGHHHKKKGKKDKRKDDKDRDSDNTNQQLKDNTPVDTFYPVCHDISLNTDWVGVNSTSYLGLPPPPPVIPGPAGTDSLWLALNNNYLDSSAFANTVTTRIAANNAPGFGTPGKFGSHYAILNWPNISTPATPDRLLVNDSGSNLILDYANGFSFSFWMQPKAVSSLGVPRHIFGKSNSGTASDYFNVGINTAGEIFAEVQPSGGGFFDSKRVVGSMVNGTWYHVAIVYNGFASILLYRDKVSTATGGSSSGFAELSIPIHVGFRSNNAPGTYYQGYIDEFKYYKSQILTQTNINNLFATNAP